MKVYGQSNEQEIRYSLLLAAEEERTRTQALEQASNENNASESDNPMRPSVPDNHPFSNILNLRLNLDGRFSGMPPVFVLKNSDQ